MRHPATALVTEACGDGPGMQTIRGNTCVAQTTREFTREQDVAELRPTISFHTAEVLCRLKILEIQLEALGPS